MNDERKEESTVAPIDNQDMLLTAINAKIEPIVRQLERMEERMESRTSNLVTRSDLESLRRELISKDALEPQLQGLKLQITRMETDRQADKQGFEKQLADMKNEQLTRNDRLWIRLAQGVGMAGFILALFDFLSHSRLLP